MRHFSVPSIGRLVPLSSVAVVLALVIATTLMLAETRDAAGVTPPSMSLSIDSVGCDTNDGPTTCNIAQGQMFTLSLYLDSLGDMGPYEGNRMVIGYSGIVTKGQPDIIWPGCVFEGDDPPLPGFVGSGCGVGIPPAPQSISYTGKIAVANFTCAASGSATLVHGGGNTYITEAGGPNWVEAGPDVLTINCVPPLAYPGDQDGDGCPDMNEAGGNPVTGGGRDFLNPWDYFDPTGDGKQRIDDINLVNQHYYIDQGNPNYTMATDRTFLGPDLWDLGPPNGLQRIDDIINAVRQYFHDCP